MDPIRRMLDEYTDATRPVRDEVARRREERMELAALVTAAQARRFHYIARTNGWVGAEVTELLARWGYSDAAAIQRGDYDRLCRALTHAPTHADVRAKCDEEADRRIAAERTAAADRLAAANRAAVRIITKGGTDDRRG